MIRDVVDLKASVLCIERHRDRHRRIGVRSERAIAVRIGKGRTSAAVRHGRPKLLRIVTHEVVAAGEIEIRCDVRMLVDAVIDHGYGDRRRTGIGDRPRTRRVNEIVVPVLDAAQACSGEAEILRPHRAGSASLAHELLFERRVEMHSRFGAAADETIDVDGGDGGIRAQRSHHRLALRRIVHAKSRGTNGGRDVTHGELRRGWMGSEASADVVADLSCALHGTHRRCTQSAGAERLLPEDDVDARRLLAASRCERVELRSAMRANEVLRGNARITLTDRDVPDNGARRAARGILGAGRDGDRDGSECDRARERTRRVSHACLGATWGDERGRVARRSPGGRP